jgi:tRNA threonylcarbamoyladenosine biosynthesis protein TsaB
VRALIIDTSSVVSVAAIDTADEARVLARFNGQDTHRHAEDLTPAVRSVLSQAGWDRPDVVLTGEGPGPFTGLRVGMATAQTLAFAWGVPVAGWCSLDGLAHAVAGVPGTDQGFVAALDARRKELYWARYDAAGHRVDGPHVSAPSSLPSDVAVAGTGVAARAQEIAELGLTVVDGTEHQHADAADLGLSWLAAGAEITEPRARYLRESDAVVPASMAGVDVTRPGTRA